MDFKQFNLLENKILQALEYINQLKAENKELREQIKQLQGQKAEALAEGQESKVNNAPALTEREIYISNKIAEMLKKIEALETKI